MTIGVVMFNLLVSLAFYCIGVIVGTEREKRSKTREYRKY